MISLSEKAKAKYAKYVGPDGKLIIDDSLPDDLKETFQYFNEKKINILEMNVDDSRVEVLDMEGSDEYSDIDESDIDDDSDIEINIDFDEEDETFDAEDLNDIF